MAIKFFEKDGKKLCQIDVYLRSPDNRKIKSARRETFVTDGLDSDGLQKHIQAIKQRLRDRASRAVFQQELAGTSWGHIVNEWKIALEAGSGGTVAVKLKTTLGYIHSLKDFTKDWENRVAADITPADVFDILHKMDKEGYSTCRRYNVKVAINRCFKWAIQKRLIKGLQLSPGMDISVIRKNSKRPEGLNRSQIIHLLDEAFTRNHEWRHVWSYVLYTGARSGEAHEARAKDVDREEKKLYFERKYGFPTGEIEPLKDGEWRQVPINEELDELLIELGIHTKSPEDFLLPRIRKWTYGEAAKVLRTFCDEIRVPSICFHTLRACWATQLLRDGVAARKVMEMGGWSDPDTMERYIRRAGIDLEGATDSLRFRTRERPARVLKLIPKAQTNSATPSTSTIDSGGTAVTTAQEPVGA